MDKILECLNIITNPSQAASGFLPKALSTLDNMLLDETIEIHPRLRHFLENRSYEKALLWIDNGVPEKGTCGKKASS